jgi:hypothetical protein
VAQIVQNSVNMHNKTRGILLPRNEEMIQSILKRIRGHKKNENGRERKEGECGK